MRVEYVLLTKLGKTLKRFSSQKPVEWINNDGRITATVEFNGKLFKYDRSKEIYQEMQFFMVINENGIFLHVNMVSIDRVILFPEDSLSKEYMKLHDDVCTLGCAVWYELPIYKLPISYERTKKGSFIYSATKSIGYAGCTSNGAAYPERKNQIYPAELYRGRSKFDQDSVWLSTDGDACYAYHHWHSLDPVVTSEILRIELEKAKKEISLIQESY